MRLIDFIVFYTMANFKRKKMDGLNWSSPLARAAFLAALSVTLLLYIAAQIFCFFTFKLNILDYHLSIIIFIIGGAMIAQVLQYLYVKKNRYEYILSEKYKPFSFSINLGVTLSFLLFILGVLGIIITAIVIGRLLTNHY